MSSSLTGPRATILVRPLLLLLLSKMLQKSPKQQADVMQRNCEISRQFLRRVLVKVFKMFPYKIQTVHQLLAVNRQTRLVYACISTKEKMIFHQKLLRAKRLISIVAAINKIRVLKTRKICVSLTLSHYTCSTLLRDVLLTPEESSVHFF